MLNLFFFCYKGNLVSIETWEKYLRHISASASHVLYCVTDQEIKRGFTRFVTSVRQRKQELIIYAPHSCSSQFQIVFYECDTCHLYISLIFLTYLICDSKTSVYNLSIILKRFTPSWMFYQQLSKIVCNPLVVNKTQDIRCAIFTPAAFDPVICIPLCTWDHRSRGCCLHGIVLPDFTRRL